MPIDKTILQDYVATANSGKYKSWEDINSKFPELKGYDAKVLQDYVATANSGKYKSWEDINSKFPELSTPVKKKEVTESDMEDGSLDTPKVEKPKPSVSSVSSKDGVEVFKGYPGKESTPYVLDTSGNAPIWKVYSHTNAGDKGNEDVYKEITDPNRVNALNKFFKKDASTYQTEQIYTGYPGKESNEYRVVGNTWERRVKGQKEWQTISNQGSIDALNSRYDKDVTLGAVGKYKNAVIDETSEKLNKIDKNLVNSSEEDVKSWINKNFPGFGVVEQGIGTDNLLIKSPSGASMSVSLNDWDDEDNNAQAIKLREFLKVNSNKQLLEAGNELLSAAESRKSLIEKQILESRTEGKTPNVFEKIDADKQIIEAEDKKFQATSDIYKTLYTQKDFEGGKEAIASLPRDKKTVDIAKRKNEELNLQYKSLKDKKENIDKLQLDLQEQVTSGEITSEEANARLNEEQSLLNEEYSSLKKNVDSLNTFKQSIEQSIASNTIINEAQGDFAGGLYKKFVSGATSLFRPLADMSREEHDKLVQDIVGNATTDEYLNSEDRSDFAKAMFSLSESMGVALPLAPLGSVATGVGFFSQSFYEMSDDLSGVEGISDNEKLIMSTGYGIVSALLENVGLGAITGKLGKDVTKGVSMAILKNTFKELPKDATREVLESIISKNAKMIMLDAGITTASAAVTEGTTEFLQKMSQEGIKELYDIAKDTDKFHNNQGFWDVVKEAAYEGKLGAIGGGTMRGASNSASILVNKLKTSVTNQQLDNEFRSLVNVVTDEDNYNATVEAVKLDIKSGGITEDEGKQKLDDLAKARDIVNQIPSDMTTAQARQAAELIKEKNEITAAIEGKDKALVTAKTDRINAINEELAKLGQDETADITTDGDVQPRVEPGDTQGEGANVQETVEPAGSEGEINQEIIKDATKESTEQQQEIPTESNIAERQGVNEGQQEVGQTEGIERETAQPEANISDSNISSETEVIPSIETKIDEYEQRTENEVVTPNTETTKTKKAKSIERTRKALDVETNDLQDLVKKHFISGGRIDAIAVTQALFGNKGSKSVAGEYRKRVGLHKKGGLTIDGLANLLWGENADILGENTTTRDWRNAIEEVLTSEGSTNDMIESLLAKAEEPLTDLEAKYWESKYDMNAIEGFDEFELMDAESVLDNMTDEEMAQMLSEIEQSEIEEYNYNEEVQQSTGQKALDWISAINSKLDEIIDPKNLNDATRVIPAIALKTILKALEVSIKAGMTVSKAVDKYFNENTEYTKEQFEATISRVPTVKSIISQSAKSQKRAFKQGKREGREETEAKLKPVIEKLRDLKKDRDAARAYILDQIKEFEGKKVLNARAVLNRLMRVNLNNATAVDNFIEYAEKAFKNAAYVDRVNAIIKMNKASKKNSKNQSVSIKSVAKRLANIDPVMVEDLDMFEEMSIKLNAATRKGDKTPINIKEATDYMEKVEAEIKEKQRLNLLGEFAELVDDGIIDKNATYEDIMAIIKGIESSDEVSNDTIEEKKAELKNKFENQKIAAQQAVRVSQTELAKAKIVEALDIDIDKLSISDAYLLVTAVDNFIENDIADNLGPLVDKYRGLDNAAKAKQSGLKAKGFMSLNRVMNNAFAAIPVVVDSMFGSVKKGSDILRLSAYNALARGAVLANRMTERVVDQYTAKFKKTTPNGERFTSVQNIYERGLLANLLRSIDDDTQIQSDFDTKKNLILQSVAKLLNSKSKTERLKGKAYTELFEKVGLEEATNVDELNIDKVNRAAVNFWIKEWSNHYDKLAEVNQVYHNSILEADRNYTPIRTTAFQGTRSQDIETVGSMFSVEMGVDKNKSGVLMENTRPKNIKDRYIDLDFDASNVRALNAALLDIHTSESAIQMDAFINSRDFDSLFEKVEDREMITSRFKNYANRARKKEAFQKGIGSVAFDKTINGLSGWGTSLVLGGLSQVPKQTISVLSNTIINAGPGNFVLLSPWGNSDMNKWIERNDLTITARGMSSRTTYEKADKILEAGGSSDSKLRKLNDFYLETFLGNADIYAARSSFMSYYIQSLKRQGELSRDIDWDNHEVNQQASEYAQHMVDRQQNVSDNAAAGEVFASNNVGLKIIRKTLLPFSTFIMNQKARMVSDIRALSDVSNNTPEERFTALRSLTGAVVEISMFVVISEFIKSGYGMVADKMAEAFGIEGGDDEEDKNKDEKRQRERGVKQAIKDILSPIPLLDNVILSGIDTALDYLQNLTDVSDDKEFKDALAKKEEAEGELSKIALESFKTSWREEREYRFSDNFVEGIFSDLGVLGISAGALKDLFDTGKKLDSDMVTVDQYGRKSEKYITNNAMNLQYTSFGLQLGHAVGIFPSDVRAIQRKVQKTIDKSALTLKQYEVYKELKEDVSDREVMLLRKSFDAIDIEDVRDAEKTLSDKQMDTYFKAVAKSPSKLYIDNMLISDIKKGMSAEAIVKKYND